MRERALDSTPPSFWGLHRPPVESDYRIATASVAISYAADDYFLAPRRTTTTRHRHGRRPPPGARPPDPAGNGGKKTYGRLRPSERLYFSYHRRTCTGGRRTTIIGTGEVISIVNCSGPGDYLVVSDAPVHRAATPHRFNTYECIRNKSLSYLLSALVDQQK